MRTIARVICFEKVFHAIVLDTHGITHHRKFASATEAMEFCDQFQYITHIEYVK